MAQFSLNRTRSFAIWRETPSSYPGTILSERKLTSGVLGAVQSRAVHCGVPILHALRREIEDQPGILERGERALDSLEQRLSLVQWLAADSFMVADIALVACTRVAAEGGFDLSGRRGVCRWIRDGELELGLAG